MRDDKGKPEEQISRPAVYTSRVFAVAVSPLNLVPCFGFNAATIPDAIITLRRGRSPSGGAAVHMRACGMIKRSCRRTRFIYFIAMRNPVSKTLVLHQLKTVLLGILLGNCSVAWAQNADSPSVRSGSAVDTNLPRADESTGASTEKSYVLPAFEIVGFEVLLNIVNRNVAPSHHDYESDLHTISENIQGGWSFDRDSFTVNQLGHPYQGSVYYTIARSSGLNFYESTGYAFGGSLLWEIAGERTKPSVNDQITTSFGGSFLGEALFRTAETFYRRADRRNEPGSAIAAGVTAPATGVNRLAFDRDVTPDIDTQRPAMSRALQVGYARNTNIHNAFEGSSSEDLAEARFRIDYGLPGKPGYEYRRPFDYYELDLALTTSGNDNVDHLIVNGLIYGEPYRADRDFRGIYGIYGSYNYVAPEIFRVASTAVSLGTTTRWKLAENVTLQNELLVGVGFGAGGSIHETQEGRSYHYGAVPQELGVAKLIFGRDVVVDLSAQHFLVTGSSSDENGSGAENVFRVTAATTVRVSGPHAVGIEFDEAHRVAPFSRTADENQRVDTVRLLYTYLFDDRLGGAEW